MRIFLGDLGHNQLTLSSDVYPLGVANLAAYAQAYSVSKEPLQITLFREPQDLKAALDNSPPDVLGLSSYAWNQELTIRIARYAKAKHPQTLTLLGGPNFPLTAAEQEMYLRSLPDFDIAVRGPTYEGERAFLNVISRFAQVGKTLAGLQEEPVPGNMWIHHKTGEFVQGAEVDRIRDLDEIPSPYLTGWMDPYFSTGYFPMMQISRGCPFACSFCNSAVKSNNKVNRHSLDNVRADLLYIAERIRPEIPLCLADDNFGMYTWDEEVADYFAYLQDRFKWPYYIRTTTGKNNQERIIRVMRKAKGALPMTAAVQSMSPEVLKNIERSNIKWDAYREIQKEIQSQGMQSYGELILCLPGETKASFMKGVHDLLDAGVTRISAHQLMLLHGAPLCNPESRKQWGFETRFRVVARNIGNYTGEPIVEVEEMVVGTSTFRYSEYLECRVFHLLLTIFYYEGNFEEAFALAKQKEVDPFEVIVRLQSMLNQAPPAFKNLIDDFIRESEEELFHTKEECLDWSHRHFAELLDGSLGGNLLSKYSMLGRFYHTQEALTFLECGIQSLFNELTVSPKPVLLRTVMEYLHCGLLHVPFMENLLENPEWNTDYDLELWNREGHEKHLEEYEYGEPQTFSTIVDAELKALIENRISTFGEHPSGLGKFTRTVFAKDLRRKFVCSKTELDSTKKVELASVQGENSEGSE